MLAWWIRWKAIRLFFADHEAAAPEPAAPALLWAQCSAGRAAGPRAGHARTHRQSVSATDCRRAAERGLLTLDPDLRPCSRAFADFILEREAELQSDLHQWEEVESGHSWRYVRLVLLASVVGLGFFVVVTQPGLQSGLVGVASAIAGGLTAIVKLRDAVTSWMSERKSTA